MKFQVLFLVFFSFFLNLQAANILAIWPVFSRSHFSVGLALFETLAEKGHTITLLSPYEQKESHENIKIVKLEKVSYSVNLISFWQMRNMSKLELMKYRVEAARDQVDFILSDKNFMNVVKSSEKFDLIMLDSFLNDALLGVGHYLQLPVVAFSTIGATKWSDEMVKNPLNFAANTNFLQRLVNSAMALIDEIIYDFYYIPSQELLYQEYFKELIPQPMPKLIDLIHNVSLVLLNSHAVTQHPKANVPNCIEVGGVHIRSLENQIHPEFLKTLDRAVNGIIYFSLGSDLKSSDLPEEKLEIFLKVFSQMKDVLILWKFESVALKERHVNNIIIGPWMPQQEILQHKNLKAFITHGGLLSTMEAIYYGKPIIGLPFFDDQKLNVAKAVAEGYGIELDYDSLTADSIKSAIDSIFNDIAFQNNAEKVSKIFRDNPINPIDKTVYYIEHAIRTNGADHLKTSATKLSFVQLHLIDQISFVIAAIIITVFALSRVLQKLRSKFQKRSKLHTKRNKFKSN